MSAIASWSGGKDSCLACYKAIKAGHKIKYLLNFVSREYKRCCFHGVKAELIKAQAELTDIPLAQKEVTANLKKYKEEFMEAVSALQTKGVDEMVFGDIYLRDQLNWVNRTCGELKIKPIEPLWGSEPDKIIEEFISAGFKALVVSCKAELFKKEFLGRYIDESFLAELKKRNICPCGENGEFHTLVVDGPIFKKRIEIIKSRPVLRDGFWKHWFLDIQKYKIA